MKRILTIFVVLLSSFAAPSFALKFNNLNEDEGLSSRRTYSVCQDKNGFIWISTKLSVDRFDGRQIKRYELSSPNEQSIDNIRFNFVKLAPDNTIWAFTQSGAIFKYDEKSDSFLFIYSIRQYYNSYSIILNDIFFDTPTQLLLATAKGILLLDTDSGKVLNCDVMDQKDVFHILKAQDYYYFSTKTGLYAVRLSTETENKIINHYLPDLFISHLYYDNKYRCFWIGTFSNGMYILSEHKGYTPFQVMPNISKPVRSIILYGENQIAVGVDGNGVFLLNRQNFETEETFVQTEKNNSSISANSVWNLFLDSQNILWIATYHKGVSFSDHSTLNFQNFTHEKNISNSLSNDYINAVLEDRDGDLWFGTNNGISLFYRQTKQWKHFFQEQDMSNGNVVLTLCESNDGTIWAGGYAFGAVTINKKNAKVQKYQAGGVSSIVGTDYIYAIHKDEYSGCLWSGGIHGKVSCYNPKTGTARLYKEESLRCFGSYDENKIILGLNRGFYLMDIQTGEKTPTRINATVNRILKDGDRAYWVATSILGLYHYDLKNDSLTRYSKETNGLSSNHIYGIEKDEDGYLWLSTEEGLNRFDPRNGSVTIFNKQDGLISNQFTPNASVRCSSSEMLFGTADGAVIFYPSEIKKTDFRAPYPLLFTEFQLFGKTVTPDENMSPLRAPINNIDRIVLPYNKNYFSLNYTLPNYQFADKIEYSYFLENYDLNWSKPSSNNTASFSKIQPGTYTLHIKALIDSRLQDERQIKIIVNQPWWNTPWAWLAYIFIVIMTGYRMYRYFSEKTKKQQTEEKMEFFINTAHDILNPLSLIEAPLKDISIKDSLSDEVKYLLLLALNNTQKLSYFVHQLIDFQKITLNANHLVVKKNNIYDFFVNKVNSYRSIASQKFISLDIHIQPTEKQILFDKEKVNKMLDNLLSNAIKYTSFGGKIDVSVSYFDNDWSFSVKDDGIGIPQRKQNMIFKYIFRADNAGNAQNVGSGVGLKMVNALVQIHKGKISFNSKQNEGSDFVITLPYRYDEKYIEKSENNIKVADFLSSESSSVNIKIFIVESEKEMSEYLHNAFSNDYTVESYATGQEALNRIIRSCPDLIIVDVKLSDMDGLTFCVKLKENTDTAYIPIVTIIEQSNLSIIKDVFMSGASDYIKKPFESEILKLKVSNLLSSQQMWKEKALSDIKKDNINTINNERDQEFMDNLIQLIEKNIDNPTLNISLLCNELALSRTLLYNRITQLTGNSPNEFIRTVRLKTAVNLLITGKYSIAEVSNMVGIDNPKYFSRIFKEYYHVSPKNYLK